MSMSSTDIDQEDGGTEEQGISEFEQLYNQSLKSFQRGSIVRARVLSVQPSAVLVDLGYKSDGIIPADQFTPEELSALKPGQELELYLEEAEDQRGNLVLSREKAKKLQVWEDLNTSYQTGTVIKGRITAKVKGGMSVDIGGVPAFLPGSQIDLRPVRDLDQYLGKVLDMKIIKMNSGRGNIVLSRRALLEDEQKERRAGLLDRIAEGALVQGTVKSVMDYGIFVDLGGVDGLLHVTDMSWGRAGKPADLYKQGDAIETIVIKFDREKGKISLGLKQKGPDPWLSVETTYPVGSVVSGKVTSLTEYGAFVELQEGVEGLVHVSEMSWTQKVKHPSKLMNVGDVIKAKVLHVDPAARRIALGTKQIEPNPWDTLVARLAAGTTIEGKVRTLTDFGAFVGIEEGIDGLIHVSDLSWTQHIKHPSEMLKKGQAVTAVVLSVDAARKRISLGLKQLTPDPWTGAIPARYKVGQDEQVKISSRTDFGYFVGLELGIEGLIPLSEIPRDSPELKIGDEVTARVLKVDRTERRVALSIKAHLRGQDKENLRDFMKQQEKLDTSIGALLKEREKTDPA